MTVYGYKIDRIFYEDEPVFPLANEMERKEQIKLVVALLDQLDQSVDLQDEVDTLLRRKFRTKKQRVRKKENQKGV